MTRSRTLLALAVLAGVSLAGCSPFRVSLRHEAPRATSQFTWKDARPAGQGDSGNESLLITSCAYGAYKIGDDKFTPDRVAVLRSDLDAALGAELVGKKVVLKNYTVHLNRAGRLRAGVDKQYSTGLIPSLMNDTSVHGCAADDLEGGFVGNEVTTQFAPLVVVIDLEVDGRKVHTRHVESASEEMESHARGDDDPAWNEFVTKALRAATSKAVDGVKALGAPGAA
jgi:hypothetical protein